MIVAGLVLSVVLAVIAAIDGRTRRIPDWLSLPLIAIGLVWSQRAGLRPFTDHLIGAGAGYASLAAFGWVYYRLRGREGLGLGDAKLFAAGGAWLGWQALPLVLLTASLGGLGYALLVRGAGGATRLAFGPWIALAIWLAWLIEWRGRM